MIRPEAPPMAPASMADLPTWSGLVRRGLRAALSGDSQSLTTLAAIAGSPVADAFEAVLANPAPAGEGGRRETLEALADRLDETLGAPRIRFLAERENVAGEETPDAVLYRIDTPSGPRRLRFSQVISARFWGLEVAPSDPRVESRLARAILLRGLTHLESDLVSLRRIETWLRGRPRLGRPPRFNPDAAGRGFEQVILDVLNEQADAARRASLYEDFVEKTDIRFRIPEGPSRGVRIQVTLSAHPDSLRARRERIDAARPPIEISPATLAALLKTRGEELLEDDELDELWEAFRWTPADEEGLARALQGLFRDVLLERDVPPGPVLALPRGCRRLVRIAAGEAPGRA